MNLIFEAFNTMTLATKMFVGNPLFVILFIIACILIIFFEKDLKNKLIIIGFPIIVCIAIYNPITYWVLKKAFRGMVEYYCRLFSLLQIGVVISYAIVLFIRKIKDWAAVVIIITFTVVIVLFGNNIYEEDWIVKSVNSSKLSNDIIEVCNTVSEDGHMHRVAVPESMTAYIRQYDANITMPYGRWDDHVLEQELNKVNPDINKVVVLGAEYECEFVVLQNNNVNKVILKEYGQNIIGETNNFLIIKLLNIERNIREYDSSGHITKVYHLNADNKEALNSNGYVYYVPKYNDKDLVVEKYFYGENKELVMTSYGFASIRYEYDNKGNIIKESYYDTEGMPCSRNDGASTIENKYDKSGTISMHIKYNIMGEIIE